MQISLRSQLAAGVAFAGAAAIAVTPIAQPSILPALQTKASVALAAFDNPLSALIGTGTLGVDFLINGNFDTGAGGGANNFPGGNVADGVNQWLYGNIAIPELGPSPRMTAIGLLPNLIQVPFPVLTQVANNWLGYANTAFEAGAAALGSLSDVLWSPVGLAINIAELALTGQFSEIPAAISEAVTQAISGVTDAVQDLVFGAVTIAENFVAKVSAVATTLAAAVPKLLTVVTLASGALVGVTTNVVTNITSALAAADFEGAWNAGVAGLLGPGENTGSGFGPSLPGALANLTLGAGQGFLADPTDPATYAFAPSVRTVVQSTGQALSEALSQTAAPAPAAAASRSAAPAAAAAEVASVADVADVTDAPAAVEAPVAAAAPSATAGDNDNGGSKASAKKSSHRAGKKASE